MLILRPFYFLLSIIRVLLISINMIFVGGAYVLVAALFSYETASHSKISWLWGRLFLLCTTTRLVIKGQENISKGKGVILLFTHSSYMDIPAITGSLTGLLNFAASAFVANIPVMGAVMRVVKTIVISNDREESIKQYKLAEERLANGDRFAISPEGGRSSGEEILPFKSGPFIFGMNAKADLVPVVIYGAHKTWPKGDLMPNMRQFFNTIYVEYMPPISTDSFTDENRKQKAEEIRQSMIPVFEKYQKK